MSRIGSVCARLKELVVLRSTTGLGVLLDVCWPQSGGVAEIGLANNGYIESKPRQSP